MYTWGLHTPLVHVADHVTYCYTLLWELGCDMIFLVLELGFEFSGCQFMKRELSHSNLVLTYRLEQDVTLLICNKRHDS